MLLASTKCDATHPHPFSESVSTKSDDRVQYKDGQRRQWDSVAAGWKKWWPTIENGAQDVSRRMLDLAGVEPGHQVLDIATGIGEPALLAARCVGPAGRVVATDLSSGMLDIARQRATGLGLTNVEFREGDAERLDFADCSFDVILCRWGLSSFPNPLDTLHAIRRMLIPNGSFAAAVWANGPRGRPLASLATAVAREIFDLPSPAPRAGSAMDALEKDLVHAGFTNVRVVEATLTLKFSSAEDCTQYLLDVSPDLAVLLSGRPSALRTEYRQSLAGRLQPHTDADGGVRIPNVAVCGVGQK
jgi:ubiquinone/menaquinone biosynthesis C-methylase UbiE